MKATLEYAITLDRFCKWVDYNHNQNYNDLVKLFYDTLDLENNYYTTSYKSFKNNSVQKWIEKFYEENKLNKEWNLIIYEIG